MTWTKTPEEWVDDPRSEGLIAPAKGLYGTAMCISNRVGNDGLLKGRTLQEAIMKADFEDDAQQRRALRSLVSSGWWHDHKTAGDCTSDYCQLFLSERGPVPKGAYLICEFHKDQPSRSQKLVPIEHRRWLRDQDLKHDKRLIEQIKMRDKDLCRYCGCRVNWADRVGPNGATYDHVDPWSTAGLRGFGNTLANVVVACRRDNGRKRDRTPEQAGMELLEPGTDLGADPVATRSAPKIDSVSRARDARDGTDRDGTQSRPGPDQQTGDPGESL